VRVSPSVMRAIRNLGSVSLVFVVIQVKAGSLQQATAADGIIGKILWFGRRNQVPIDGRSIRATKTVGVCGNCRATETRSVSGTGYFDFGTSSVRNRCFALFLRCRATDPKPPLLKTVCNNKRVHDLTLLVSERDRRYS
jgi:hypothetical protein